MFEKDKEGAEPVAPVTPPKDNVVVKPDEDYGLFNGVVITLEGDDVVIKYPLNYGINTVRAAKQVIAAWAVDNVAGKLLSEAKKWKP